MYTKNFEYWKPIYVTNVLTQQNVVSMTIFNVLNSQTVIL